jgi:hypothetical protein
MPVGPPEDLERVQRRAGHLAEGQAGARGRGVVVGGVTPQALLVRVNSCKPNRLILSE